MSDRYHTEITVWEGVSMPYYRSLRNTVLNFTLVFNICIAPFLRE